MQTLSRPITIAKKQPQDSFRWGWRDAALLALLVLTELIAFGPVVKKVGFYLDDWSALATLRFGPADYFGRLANYFFEDGKVLIRPVEVPWFGTLYSWFGQQPLGYHVVNGVFEVLSAVLLYAVVAKFIGSRLIAFFAASCLLLYPTHDATHYWVLASSCTLSLVLYLGSLWTGLEAACGRRLMWAASLGLFAAATYNYESFMPLAAISSISVFALRLKREGFARAMRTAALYTAGLGGIILSFWLYLRLIVPRLGDNALMHKVHLDPLNMVQTVANGCWVSSPAATFPFMLDLIRSHLQQAPVNGELMLLVLFVVVNVVACWLCFSEQISRGSIAKALIVGCIAVPISYTVFGLNPEYKPTLITIFNRINYGAALGVGLIYGALVAAAIHYAQQLKARPLLLSVTSACVVSFSLLCLTASWAMSAPWSISWVAQKHIFDVMKSNAAPLNAAESVLLANCPRYVHWSPVFDGVWDFQAAARLATDNEHLNAGVVSERLTVDGAVLKDVSLGALCATYPLANMYLLIPVPGEIVAVNSADGFVETVSTRGMGFGLDAAAVERWRLESAGKVKAISHY